MVATAVFEEVHWTLVRVGVDPSARWPMAVNVTVPPGATVVFPLMVIDWRAAARTVAVVVPLIAPDVAVMVEVPAATPVSNPLVLIVALAVLELLQVTLLRVLVLPSSLTPEADICWVLPTAMLGDAGVTVIDCRTGSVKKPWQAIMNARVNNKARDDAARTLNRLFNMMF